MVAGANGEDMSVMMGGVRKIGTRTEVNCVRLVCHLTSISLQMERITNANANIRELGSTGLPPLTCFHITSMEININENTNTTEQEMGSTGLPTSTRFHNTLMERNTDENTNTRTNTTK